MKFPAILQLHRSSLTMTWKVFLPEKVVEL
ncbi:hypothetical protein A2U01_0085182, partial [Trifolium medium]|nr:hypothetical protein [Trifolium medium]